jgi:hypothetical protein
MTLEQATSAALEAAQAGDLETLELALAARHAALNQNEAPITPGILAAGELTTHLLQELIRNTRMEAARLRHIADGFRPDAPLASHVDFVG